LLTRVSRCWFNFGGNAKNGYEFCIIAGLTPTGDEPDLIKEIDVVMLAVTGGLARTEAHYASLLDAAGLRLEQVVQA
jgi:hypothetical protein